jgi:hypothetical protein
MKYYPSPLDVPSSFMASSGSLKTLHISFVPGGVEPWAFQEYILPELASAYIGNPLELDQLENLILISPIFYKACWHSNGPTWAMKYWGIHNLAHMVALKRLHISDLFIHHNLFIKPPPFLTTLVIAVHDPASRPINFVDLFKFLPPTVKTLICEVGGRNTDEQWTYLAEHSQFDCDFDLDSIPRPLLEGNFNNNSLVDIIPPEDTFLIENELMAHIQALKKLIATKVHVLGIDFRLEPLQGECCWSIVCNS